MATGKMARLPVAIREDVNGRPRDDVRSLAESVQAAGSGMILELLKRANKAKEVDRFCKLMETLKGVRATEINQQRANTKDRQEARAAQKDRRKECEDTLKAADDKRVQELAAAPLSNAAKIEELGRLMFGDLWDPPTGPNPFEGK